jgi:hypothetical protein
MLVLKFRVMVGCYGELEIGTGVCVCMCEWRRVCDESIGRNREKNIYERGRSGGNLTWCVVSMQRLGWRLAHWHCREVTYLVC